MKMTDLNSIKPILPISLLLLFLLTSCGIYKPSDARTVSPNVDERVKNLYKKEEDLGLERVE